MVDIDKDAIENYQTKRLESGAAPATINRETAYLKLGIKLLGLPVPVVEKLKEDNVRQGFICVGDFNARCRSLLHVSQIYVKRQTLLILKSGVIQFDTPSAVSSGFVLDLLSGFEG